MQRVLKNNIGLYKLRMFWARFFLCASVLVALSYVYFVNHAVFTAVHTRDFQTRIIEISSHLNTLQKEYFSLKGSATIEKAHDMGLSETNNPVFVSRKSLGRGLSLRDEI